MSYLKNLSKEGKRTKMQLWAMAQIDYIENQNLNNLAFEVIQKSGTNPIIQVNEKNKNYRSPQYKMG